MIDELDEALRQLLIRELPIQNGEVDIAFHQPKREWSARVSHPTLNCFLYDIRENQKLRQTQPMWETERNPDGSATQRRKPVRLDLYYLLTAWATEPEDEHRLLNRALMTFFRFPALPEDCLPDALRQADRPIPILISQYTESPNVADIWSVLDNEMRPAISLLVTLSIDPYTEWRVPLVRQREIRVGASERPETRRLDSSAPPDAFWTIGGTLRSQASLDFSTLTLKLVESGQPVMVAPDGRFMVGRLKAGQYTLEVLAENQSARRFDLQVPAPDFELDL